MQAAAVAAAAARGWAAEGVLEGGAAWEGEGGWGAEGEGALGGEEAWARVGETVGAVVGKKGAEEAGRVVVEGQPEAGGAAALAADRGHRQPRVDRL